MDKLKTKLHKADWWEITYLIIYGSIFTYEFLNTTMFQIQWPPKFGYIFLASSALYTIAKFIWHNTYTKKETILSAVILFAFIMPAILTDYSFLWWVGFLIVGAKDINFKKILKVYIVIGISIMIIAFSASQYGIIEDLQYLTYQGEEVIIRHAYGIIYPTDFAAHVFYLVLAIVIYVDEKMTVVCKVWIISLVAIFLYMVANAKTSTICLIMFLVLCLFDKIFRNKIALIGLIMEFVPILCAIGFVLLSYNYNPEQAWMLKINQLLTGRLELSKIGFDNYPIKMFGQFIEEVGNGSSTVDRWDYFFIDDVYVRILLEYGVVLFIVTLIILMLAINGAKKRKDFLFIMVMIVISVHSIMEHHLLEIAYNPFVFAILAMQETKEIGGKHV